MLLLWLLLKVPGLVRATFGGRAEGGRWVRDRSLGGKMVRICCCAAVPACSQALHGV